MQAIYAMCVVLICARHICECVSVPVSRHASPRPAWCVRTSATAATDWQALSHIRPSGHTLNLYMVINPHVLTLAALARFPVITNFWLSSSPLLLGWSLLLKPS